MENEFDDDVHLAVTIVFLVALFIGILAGGSLLYYIYKDDHVQVARVFSGENKCEIAKK